ncbi:MAG: hypothetical protein ACO3JL_06425 [Myxococcota bacterium]
MSEDELKGFKVSSQVQRRVDRAPSKPTGAGAAPSVGFPRIENLVGSATPDFSGLEARAAQLQELASKGSLKEKPAARKAAIAYERTGDLLEHLLQVKASLGGKQSD